MNNKSTKIIILVLITAILTMACNLSNIVGEVTGANDRHATETAIVQMTEEARATNTAIAEATRTAQAQQEIEAQIQQNQVAIIETNNSDYGLIVVHENGEQMVTKTGEMTTGGIPEVTGAVWFSPEGDGFMVENGSDGLPGRVFVDGFTIILSDYTANSVNAAIISPQNQVEFVENIPVDAGALSELQSFATSSIETGKVLARPITQMNYREIAQALRWTSLVISVAGCVTAGIATTAVTFGAALAVLAVPCGAAIVSAIAILSENEDDVMVSASQTALGVIGCGTFEPGSCAALVLDTTATIVNAADESFPEKEAAVEQALSSERIIGAWTLYFDWNCTGDSNETSWVFYEEELISGNNYTATWELNGDRITIVYQTDNQTTYIGTVENGYMEGTMSNNPGSSGCWTATKND